MWRKNVRKSMILVPRGSQNRSKLFRGALRKRSWKQVGSGTPKKCQRQLHGTSIWVLFRWSWAPFWPPLGAKGSQNQAFWHQGCAKIWKYDIQNEAPEKNEISIELCPENVNFWMGWISRNALYKSISMVLSHYNKMEHLIENCHQHGTQNAYKIRQKLT